MWGQGAGDPELILTLPPPPGVQQNIGEILVVEPNIKALPASLSELKPNLVSLPEAIEKANILLILVDHKQFKALSLAEVARKIVIDTRGIFG